MRVVSLVASNTEIVCALGRGDWLVGVDDFSDYPDAVRTLPRLGPDLRIDAARVAALRPDVVLASLSVPGMERSVAGLRERALPVEIVPSSGLDGVFAAIRMIGALLDGDAAARALEERMRARMAAVAERVGGLPAVPTYWEWWPRPPITAGGRSWMTELLALAGGRNVFADLDAESGAVTLDDVAGRAPRAVVLCWCGARKRPDPRQVARRPGWGAVPGVRDGRIFAVLEPCYGRPGPRLVDGLDELAGLLHPRAGGRAPHAAAGRVGSPGRRG